MLNMISWPYPSKTKRTKKEEKRSRRRQAGKSWRLLDRLGMKPAATLRNQPGEKQWPPFRPLSGVQFPRLPNDDPKMDTRRRGGRGKILGGKNGGEKAWKQLGQRVKKPVSRHSLKHHLRLEIQDELREIQEWPKQCSYPLGIPGFILGQSFSFWLYQRQSQS